MALYEKAGFVRDGILPGTHLLPGGSREDLIVMSTMDGARPGTRRDGP